MLLSKTDQNFINWCVQNGVKTGKVEIFQTFFGGRGLKATENINHKDTVLEIPNKLIYSTYRISKLPEYAQMFNDLGLFQEDVKSQYLILTVFLMNEKLKGEASFIYPWLQVHPEKLTCLFYGFPKELVSECQLPIMEKDLILLTELMDSLYDRYKSLPLSKYLPLLAQATKEDFDWAYLNMSQRHFDEPFFAGYAIMPFVDMINHNDTGDLLYCIEPQEVFRRIFKRAGGKIREDGKFYHLGKEKMTHEWNYEMVAIVPEKECLGEIWDLNDDTIYFKFIYNGEATINKGEEIYLNYDYSTNRLLLSWYGFNLESNKDDRHVIRLNMLDYQAINEQSKISNLKKLNMKEQIEIHLCQNIVNVDFVRFLRCMYENDPINVDLGAKKISTELKIWEEIKRIFDDTLENMATSLEEDLDIVKNNELLFDKKCVMNLRIGVKNILNMQTELAVDTLEYLKSGIDTKKILDGPSKPYYNELCHLKQK